jgi:hypothetical protein
VIIVKDVMAFFQMGAAQFSKDWKQLTPKDKEDLKTGLAGYAAGNQDCTFTY